MMGKTSEKNEDSATPSGDTKADEPKKRKGGRKRLSILVIVIGLAVIAGGVWLYVQNQGVPDFIAGLIDQTQEEEGPEKVEVCLDKILPDTAVETVDSWTASEDLTGKEVSTTRFSGNPGSSCDVVVSTRDNSKYDLVYRNYYVLVKNKKADLETITMKELALILGQGSADIGEKNTTYSIEVGENAFAPVDRIVGIGVSVKPSEDVFDMVEANEDVLGVIPFEDITCTVDVVPVEGISLLSSDDISDYPLREEVWVDEGKESGLFAKLQESLGSGNYDKEAVKTVVITGTSVVGARGHYQQSVATDDWMHAVGDVGDILRSADIAHISNEGSFVPGCVQNTWTMVFCGPPEAFELLTWSGIDVVGLTGNHILDFSANNFLSTLDMYEDEGIEYFGGGRNYEDAHTAAVIDLGTAKVGFLGYNMIPPISSFATGDDPGSAELQVASIQKDIAAIRDEVDVIFVDMQWGNEYEHQPNSYQIDYGHAAIDAGADIVSGVHPHWVQPVEYYKDGVIFYSLGNFIFDQLWSRETREGVMVRHYLYNGSYVGYELIPTFLSDELVIEPVDGEDAERITGYVLDGLAQ